MHRYVFSLKIQVKCKLENLLKIRLFIFFIWIRSIDGTCNNLWKPLWGASMTPFRRNLQPQYEDFLSHPIGL